MEDITEHQAQQISEIYLQVRAFADYAHVGNQNRFSILHAPAFYTDIPCMLIGENPAAEELLPNEEQGPPNENILLTQRNIYSLTATSFFHRAGKLQSLQFAQSTDVSFFRKPYGTMNAPRGVRGTLSTICFPYLLDLIEIFSPRSLVVVGFSALGRIAKYLDIDRPKHGAPFTFKGPNGATISSVGIVHLSKPTQFGQPGIEASIDGICQVVPDP